MLSLQWSGCQWCLREWSFLAMSLREASLHVACMSARYVRVLGEGEGGVFRYTSLMLLSLLLLTPLLFLLPPRSLSFSLPTSLSSSLQAGALWNTYRQFEQAVLSSIQVRDVAWCWGPLLYIWALFMGFHLFELYLWALISILFIFSLSKCSSMILGMTHSDHKCKYPSPIPMHCNQAHGDMGMRLRV